MSAIPWSLDSASKLWLTVLAVAVVASAAVLAHSFVRALSPEQNIITAQSSPSEGTEQVRERTEPTWNAPQPVPGGMQSQVAEQSRVSPFDSQKPAPRKPDPAEHQEMVHQQSDYLRNLIAKGKLPKGLGNLTKEDVDEMEKKGILIE